MRTVFKVIADTKKMTVYTEVRQGGKLMWTKKYPTIVAALEDMLHGIATVQQRNAEEATKEIALS